MKQLSIVGVPKAPRARIGVRARSDGISIKPGADQSGRRRGRLDGGGISSGEGAATGADARAITSASATTNRNKRSDPNGTRRQGAPLRAAESVPR